MTYRISILSEILSQVVGEDSLILNAIFGRRSFAIALTINSNECGKPKSESKTFLLLEYAVTESPTYPSWEKDGKHMKNNCAKSIDRRSFSHEVHMFHPAQILHNLPQK